MSQSSYCDWESDLSTPKAENILKLSQLFNIDIKDLIDPSSSINIINSPNSKIETSEALIKVADGLDRLILLMEKLLNK